MVTPNSPAACPALLVAAPASGQGKTTVACALARLHVRQGRRVRAFKCGPDFLDAGGLALACQAPVHSLDLWTTGEADSANRVWAECGGMMALFEELRTTDGQTHAMWGLLPGQVTVQARPAALGPQQLMLGGHVLRGHTFHHSTCESPLTPVARTSRPDTPAVAGQGEALYQRGALRASYFHAWFASNPQAAARLFLPAGAGA